MVGVLSNKISRTDLKPGDHIYSWRHGYVYTHHGIYIGEEKVVHFTKGGSGSGKGTMLDRLAVSSSPVPIDCLGNPCPRCGDQSKLDGVICSCIDCFLSGDELYQFQYSVSYVFFLAKVRGGTCTLAPSDPPEDVIHRANVLLKMNGFGAYNLSNNNCEDFAIYCKTGLLLLNNMFSPIGTVGGSGQASSILAVAASAVASSPIRYLTGPIRYLTGTTFMTSGFPGTVAFGCGMYCMNRVVSDIGVRSDVRKVEVEFLVSQFGLDDRKMQTNSSNTEPTPPDQVKKD